MHRSSVRTPSLPPSLCACPGALQSRTNAVLVPQMHLVLLIPCAPLGHVESDAFEQWRSVVRGRLLITALQRQQLAMHGWEAPPVHAAMLHEVAGMLPKTTALLLDDSGRFVAAAEAMYAGSTLEHLLSLRE